MPFVDGVGSTGSIASDSYVNHGVVFDGVNDYLHRGSALTGDADGPLGILSFWFKITGGNGASSRAILRNHSTATVNVSLVSTNKLNITLNALGGTPSFSGTSTTVFLADPTTWHHFIASWDTNHAAGAKILNMYVDGINVNPVLTDTGAAFNINYTRGDWGIGAADNGINKFTGELGEFYFNTHEFLDVTQLPVRYKFRSLTDCPADLGENGQLPTGTSPILYLNGDKSTFNHNNGTGGDMIVVGALDDSSPPMCVVSPGGDVLLTTQTFISRSASTQTSLPHRFVGCFARGDVPAGTHVVLKNSGIDWPSQQDEPNYYADGSLQLVVFRAVINSLAAGASWTWQLYKRSGTYTPAAPIRSKTDITGSHDYKTLLTDLQDHTGATVGSGAYTTAANTNLADAVRTQTYASGAQCIAFKTWGKFLDNVGGAAHAHLQEKSIYEVWTNPADNSVLAIMHTALISQGWRNVASPVGLSFKTSRNDGASIVLQPSGQAYNFAPTDIDITNNRITAGAMSALRTGQMVKISTSGSLTGTGLTAGHVYFVRNNGDSYIYLHISADDALSGDIYGSGSETIDLTGQGTGTHTVTLYNYLYPHCGFNLRDAVGQETWTSHKPLIDQQFTPTEKQYYSNAGFAWPFDYSVNPGDNNDVDYYAGSLCWPVMPARDDYASPGYLRYFMDDYGGSPSLYVWGTGASRAWLKNSAVNLKVARILGLCAAHLQMIWWDPSLVSGQECNRVLTLNNGSNDAGLAFSGMGTPMANVGYFNWAGAYEADVYWGSLWGGMRGDGNRRDAPSKPSGDGSHWPQMSYVAFLLTGDPILRELCYLSANHPIWHSNVAGSTRTKAKGGVTYYGNVCHWQQMRCDGYGLMHGLYAAVLAPSGSGENAMFTKIFNDDMAYYLQYAANEDGSYGNYGHWTPRANSWDAPNVSPTNAANYITGGPWQMNWNVCVYLQASRLWGTTNAIAVANEFVKFTKNMAGAGTFEGNGPYWANSYFMSMRASTSALTYMAPSDWGIGNGTGTFGAANTIALNTALLTGVAVGGQIQFIEDSGVTLPPELSGGTKYWIVSISGLNIQISDTSGGPVKAFTNNGHAVNAFFFPPPGVSGFQPAGGEPDYAQMLTAPMVYAAALGLPGCDTIAADLLNRLSVMSWQLSGDPRFAWNTRLLQ
jgi:hypothetical protein